MASEKRLIDANKARVVAQRIYSDPVLVHAILNTLNNTPTVDAVEVVHGLWAERYISIIGQTRYFCSECLTFHERKSNYCPNCGAKMDGDGNGMQ